MKSTKSLIGLVLTVLFLLVQGASAVPVFQAYIDGATPDSLDLDENTWFTNSSSFDLIVAGAYQPGIESLVEVTLLISVPEGETGSIYITSGHDVTLLTERTETVDGYYNPNVDAVLDLLENEAGNPAGYDGYSETDFLPEGTNFNNHYPLKDDVSNFLIYGLGDFEKISNAVSNYSTEEPIEYNIADGEEKVYSILIEGFSAAHFDVYGYADMGDCKIFQSTWSINPGSHDATYRVPEPATVCLLGLGSMVLLKGSRRRSHS